MEHMSSVIAIQFFNDLFYSIMLAKGIVSYTETHTPVMGMIMRFHIERCKIEFS